MANLPLAIENWNVEPRVVGAESGRPHDRLNLTGVEIQLKGRRQLDLGGSKPMRWSHLIVEPIGLRPGVNGVEQSTHFKVGQLARVAQRARELSLAVSD